MRKGSLYAKDGTKVNIMFINCSNYREFLVRVHFYHGVTAIETAGEARKKIKTDALFPYIDLSLYVSKTIGRPQLILLEKYLLIGVIEISLSASVGFLNHFCARARNNAGIYKDNAKNNIITYRRHSIGCCARRRERASSSSPSGVSYHLFYFILLN